MAFLKLFKYLKGRRFLFFIGILFLIISSFLALSLSVLYGYMVDSLRDLDYDRFFLILYITISFIFSSFLFIYFANLIMLNINVYLVYNLRESLFNKFLHLKMSNMDKYMSGDIVLLFTLDIDQVSDGITSAFLDLLVGVFTIIFTLGFILYTNLYIFIFIVCFTPFTILTSYLIAKFSFKHYQKQAELKKELSSCYSYSLDMFLESKAFNHEEMLFKKASVINNELKKSSLKAQFFGSLTNPTTRFLNALLFAGVGILGIYLMSLDNTSISIGVFQTLLLFTSNYTKPFNDISNVICDLENSLSSLNRINVFLALEEEDIVSSPSLVVSGDISFRDVSFSYNNKCTILDNLSFNIKKGEHIAIVGSTGSGKSTIISLLLRFYNINSGSIYLDDYNINDLSLDVLRSNLSLVLQEAWIKKMSVFENIRYGTNKTLDDVIYASKKTKAHSFIKKLKDGYNTIISDSLLSEGEKQLIAITRIFLRDTNILILDEATSNIDTRSEIMIQNALLNLMENKTAIIIAHRLKTIENADRIIYLDKGRIVEVGSHKELLLRDGMYKKLYLSQFN